MNKNNSTFKDILNQFKQVYPSIEVIDYRPVCHELFEKDKIGITIWTINNDMIVYYPGENQ